MSQDIKKLIAQLQGYYQSSGRKPGGLYDLLLSFIFWEAVSEQEHTEAQQPGISYSQGMHTDITPKEAMTALRSWKKLVPHLPKDLLLPDKDSIDHLPNREWQQICTAWIAYGKYKKRLGENYLEAALDHLEILVANPHNDEGYLTPRAVIHAMVQYLEGGKGASLYDPYPRTGNLLSAAAAQIGAATNIKGGPPDRLAHKLMAIRLLLLNNNLNTLPHISHKLSTTTEQPFDYILSNPPFGTGAIDHILPKTNGVWTAIAQSSRRLDVAFLCHILSHLSANGRAAVIVPTIYLSSSNTVVGRLVKEIVDQNLLDVVIKLPGDLFATTKVATAILCFNKARQANQEVYFIDAANTIDKKEKQVSLDESELKAWLEQVKNKEVGRNVGMASVFQIIENEYKLQPEHYIKKTALIPAHQTAKALWQQCEQLELKWTTAREVVQQFLNSY